MNPRYSSSFAILAVALLACSGVEELDPRSSRDPAREDDAGASQGDGGVDPSSKSDAGDESGRDAGHGSDAAVDEPTPGFRTVGYYPVWRGLPSLAQRLDGAGLTHVVLAFANPALRGGDVAVDLPVSDAELDAFVASAHAAGTEVMISIGGGDESGAVSAVLASHGDATIASLLAFMEAHDLDGLDVDVEGETPATELYTDFVLKAAEAVHGAGLTLSAAFPGWILSRVSPDVLATFDHVNVMAYDHCGGWTRACEQSTYAHALADLEAGTQAGVPASKLVLGVPFYAWCWGHCTAAALTYAELLQRFPAAADADWLEADGASYSYNGVDTLRRKVELAGGYGGIMIWELGQDAAAPHSLLEVVTARP
jgi:chitinase